MKKKSNNDASSNDMRPIIASNLNLLATIYGKTRRQVCEDLDISYTTYCDWVNARTYPRMEPLIALANYYGISVRNLLSDLKYSESMLSRLQNQANELGIESASLRDMAITNHLPVPTASIQTASDYYTSPEAYCSELIKGHFYTHAPSDSIHQRLLLELTENLMMHIRRNKINASIFIGPMPVELPHSEGSVVLPDISVVYDKSFIDSQGCKGAPDVIFEIASESSFEIDTRIKQPLYETAGVKEYWVVDPSHKKVFVYRQQRETGNFFYNRSGQYSFRDYISSDIIPGFTIRLSGLDF